MNLYNKIKCIVLYCFNVYQLFIFFIILDKIKKEFKKANYLVKIQKFYIYI